LDVLKSATLVRRRFSPLIPSGVPLLPIAACALLSVIVIAGSIHLARRNGRWLMAVGPLAAAALFVALAQWPRAEPAAADPAPPVSMDAPASTPAEPPASAEPEPDPDDAPAPAPVAEPVSLTPPSLVVLRGRWTAEDSAVVASVLSQALARVPAAGGAVVELAGTGRALRPTSGGVQQYAIAATWTLRPAPDADVLAGSGLGEVLGLGASPDQARRGAAANAARSIAATLRASLPAPRSAAGSSSPSF
jgi:hypothetical protein